MTYRLQLKMAHIAGGPKAVCDEVNRVMQEACRISGRWDARLVEHAFERNGCSDIYPVFSFCQELNGHCTFYDINLRQRSDTPSKQMRDLGELFKKYRPMRATLDSEFSFMMEAAAHVTNKTIGDMMAVLERNEHHGLGAKVVASMARTSLWLIEYDFKGNHIEEFKHKALIAKLTL